MKLTFLGTGTSTGVPQMRCSCAACTSTDPRDKRLRCSSILEVDGTNILIDCGPDFRQQILSFYPHGDIDALLVTHHHYDHVGGTDDLRPYVPHEPGKSFPVYGNADIVADFKRRMPYCFNEPPYPGVPRFDMHVVKPYEPFNIQGVEIEPLAVNHYILEILGYKIGQLGYITDAKHVPERTIERLHGVDTLVINALRHDEHISHLSLAQSIAVIDKIRPRRAFLIHMSHDMGPVAEAENILKQTGAKVAPACQTEISFAYDGLTIEI